MTDEHFAMQTRCVHCLGTQYALSVYFVSIGEQPCNLCGRYSEKMTEGQYRRAIRRTTARLPQDDAPVPRPRRPAE